MNEAAREVARAIARTQQFAQTRRDRKKVEMLFAHLKRILRLGRLRLRGPRGAQFEFTLAATAQNLRRLGKLIARPPPLAASDAACVACDNRGQHLPAARSRAGGKPGINVAAIARWRQLPRSPTTSATISAHLGHARAT